MFFLNDGMKKIIIWQVIVYVIKVKNFLALVCNKKMNEWQ